RLGGHHRWRAHAGSALPRRCPCRDRHEHRRHRSWAVRRSPGHGRGCAVRQARIGCASRAGCRGMRHFEGAPAGCPRTGSRPSSGVMMKVVLATHNPHKVTEFQQILAMTRPDLEVVGYDGPEPVEDGVTFAENALLKARAASAHTGLAAMADDSGICVDVLGGSPGIFSASWAGQKKDAAANLELLLDQLADIADPHRTAQFVSTIALVTPDGREETVVGVWPGGLAAAPTGESGFGYDPIFIPDGQRAGAERTSAELSNEEKQSQSHRARAFEAFVPLLATL